MTRTFALTTMLSKKIAFAAGVRKIFRTTSTGRGTMQYALNNVPRPSRCTSPLTRRRSNTGLGSRMTLHEVLDHALFGSHELDLAPLFGNFPLQTVVEPVPSAPGLDDIARYHRNVLNNSLRRSARNQPATPAPNEPDSVVREISALHRLFRTSRHLPLSNCDTTLYRPEKPKSQISPLI